MKKIKLTQGKFTKVDDLDYKFLNQWKWYAIKSRNTYYARRAIYVNGKQKILFMHRVILNTPPGKLTDHADGDGLNNRRYNLRDCNNSQNMMNRRPSGKSKYLGVCRKTNRNCFEAQINVNKKKLHLGYFKIEKNAAKAYDKAAKKYFKEFANLNFK